MIFSISHALENCGAEGQFYLLFLPIFMACFSLLRESYNVIEKKIRK